MSRSGRPGRDLGDTGRPDYRCLIWFGRWEEGLRELDALGPDLEDRELGRDVFGMHIDGLRISAAGPGSSPKRDAWPKRDAAPSAGSPSERLTVS